MTGICSKFRALPLIDTLFVEVETSNYIVSSLQINMESKALSTTFLSRSIYSAAEQGARRGGHPNPNIHKMLHTWMCSPGPPLHGTSCCIAEIWVRKRSQVFKVGGFVRLFSASFDEIVDLTTQLLLKNLNLLNEK